MTSIATSLQYDPEQRTRADVWPWRGKITWELIVAHTAVIRTRRAYALTAWCNTAASIRLGDEYTTVGVVGELCSV